MLEKPLAFFEKYSIHRKLPNSDETVLRDHSSNNFVLMKEVYVQDTEQFKKVIETLQSQRYLAHDHLLSLLNYHTSPHFDPMTQRTTHKIITFFQYSSHNLLEQIEARINTNRMFTESELWSILTSSVLALAYLQKQSIGHGCVSPLDIFIQNDGAVKTVDPSIASSSPFAIIQGYYYSPEIFEHVNSEEDPALPVDIFKADVFSLAVCILHAGLLDSMDDCFDYNQGSVDFDRLQMKVENFCQVYSRDLVDVVVSMLNEQVENRPDFIQLELDLGSIFDENQNLRESRAFSQNCTLSQQFENSMLMSRQSSVYTPTSQFKLNNTTMTGNTFTKNYAPNPCQNMQQEIQDNPNSTQGIPLFTTTETLVIDCNEDLNMLCSVGSNNLSVSNGSIPRPRDSQGFRPQHTDSIQQYHREIPRRNIGDAQPNNVNLTNNYLIPQTEARQQSVQSQYQAVPGPQNLVRQPVERSTPSKPSQLSNEKRPHNMIVTNHIQGSLPTSPSKFMVPEPLRIVEFNNSSASSGLYSRDLSISNSQSILKNVVITTASPIPVQAIPHRPLSFSKQIIVRNPLVMNPTNQTTIVSPTKVVTPGVTTTVTTTKHEIIVSPFGKQQQQTVYPQQSNQQIFTDPNLLAMMRQDVERILSRSNTSSVLNKENVMQSAARF